MNGLPLSSLSDRARRRLWAGRVSLMSGHVVDRRSHKRESKAAKGFSEPPVPFLRIDVDFKILTLRKSVGKNFYFRMAAAHRADTDIFNIAFTRCVLRLHKRKK